MNYLQEQTLKIMSNDAEQHHELYKICWNNYLLPSILRIITAQVWEDGERQDTIMNCTNYSALGSCNGPGQRMEVHVPAHISERISKERPRTIWSDVISRDANHGLIYVRPLDRKKSQVKENFDGWRV